VFHRSFGEVNKSLLNLDMQLLPYRGISSLNHQELYKFLFRIKENCPQDNFKQLVSFSQDIDFVDPLIAFDKLAQPNNLNFYWEYKSEQEAFAAFDAVEKIETTGSNRFAVVENFIKNCLGKLIIFKSENNKKNNDIYLPRFLCAFSFFHSQQISFPFPAATIFLPRWQITVKAEKCVLTANLFLSKNSDLDKIIENVYNFYQKINTLVDKSLKLDLDQGILKQKYVNGADKFKNSVESALTEIYNEKLSKVVLANALDVSSNIAFNTSKSLNNLREIYPNCYVFCVSNGKGENFIGASPERLISIKQKLLITDALAGSAPRGKTPAEDAANANSLLSSKKERREHELVMEFIKQKLLELELLPQVQAARLLQLSNIQHLWTPITSEVTTNINPLQIVAQLHPTPAVAGATTEMACAAIQKYENFPRGLYAAPLGWVDGNGNCEFIVAIRSALINGEFARLYAGAGIVAGSNPDKEFAEIQLKLQALLKALV
jgi:menaquinone-specific isochorismate synthase